MENDSCSQNEARHDMRQCYERVHPDFMRLYVHFAPSYLARMRQVLDLAHFW